MLHMQPLLSFPGSTFIASLLLAWTTIAGPSTAIDSITYHGVLESPGGDLKFGLVLVFDGSTLQNAEIVNGPERQPISEFALESDQLILRFPHYNSEIKARFTDDRQRMTGTWSKRSGAKMTEMSFRAEAAMKSNQAPVHETAPVHEVDRFAGRWRATFESSDDPAVAIFDVERGTVQGTFLTTTGDYRYLAGIVLNGRLRLSTFDGAHAFLFDATLGADGALAGNFWSGSSWHEKWTAMRDDAAKLPDGFEQVHVVQQPDWSELSLRDLQGDAQTLDNGTFFGDLTIINVFGSWCPNCHDEAPFLVDLEKRYATHGLKVVGLAFEAAGDFDQDVVQVNRFIKRHSVTYPVFLGGISDKQKATEAIGFIDEIKAYPTSIFVDRAGKVIAIYSGFSGPATGAAHLELKQRFVQIIQRQLNLDSK